MSISRSAIGPVRQKTVVDRELQTAGFTGSWRTKLNHGPHRDVRAFKPSSAAEAKAFLSQVAFQLPEDLIKARGDTPLSSRTVKRQGRPENMQCHGCHGLMGGGAHNGSATGKKNCTFLHNLACPGGIKEDDSWNACPPEYVFQGFDQTMSSQDFRPNSQQPSQLQPPPMDDIIHTSGGQTPGEGQSHTQLPVGQQQGVPLQVAPQNDLYAPNMPTYVSPPLSEDQTILDQHRHQRQEAGEGARPRVGASTSGMSQPVHQINNDMQAQMDQHRATNQTETFNKDRPSATDGLNIRDIRADQVQQDLARDQMGGYRERIPSLSSAPTAAVPQTTNGQQIPQSQYTPQTSQQLPQAAQHHLQSNQNVPPSTHITPQSNQHAPHTGTQPGQNLPFAATQASQQVPYTGPHFPQATPQAHDGAKASQHIPHTVPQKDSHFPHMAPQSSHPNAAPVISQHVSQTSQQFPSRQVPSAAPQNSQYVPHDVPHTSQQGSHTGQQVPNVAPHSSGQFLYGAPQPGQQVPSLSSHHGQSVPAHVGQQIPAQSNQQVFHNPLSGNQAAPSLISFPPSPSPGSQFLPQAGQQVPHTVRGAHLVHQTVPPHSHPVQAAPNFPAQAPHGASSYPQIAPHNPIYTNQSLPPSHGYPTAPQGQQTHMPQQWQQQPPLMADQQASEVSAHWPQQQLHHQQGYPGTHRQPQPSVYPQSQPPQYRPQLPAQTGQSSCPNSNGQMGVATGGTYTHGGVHDVPIMAAPPKGSTPFTPVYDYYTDANGQPCKVLRAPQQPPQYKTVYRCSPTTGRLYTTQVLIEATATPPVRSHLEWRCDEVTGERFQVEVPPNRQSPLPNQPLNFPGVNTAQAGIGYHHGSLPWQSASQPCSGPPLPPQTQAQPHHQGVGGQRQGQLQQHLQGIVKLVEGGVTKKPAKTLDFAKKCSAKWAKKVTSESINLPLFTYGAITELESSLSGRSDPLAEGELLAKLRHIKNFLEVCCLNSEMTDFKGYGWTIAKDYALKVEGDVDQQITTWSEMSNGVQTNQLVLAQMDFPRPSFVNKKAGTGKEPDGKLGTSVKERCRTYNSCKTEDKCEYELSNPDKKCILKHECNWCRSNLKISFKHQEWACKKKN